MNQKELILKKEEAIRRLASENLTSEMRNELKYSVKIYDQLIIEQGDKEFVIKKRKYTQVTLRKAMIIVFEEYLQLNDKPRSFYTIKGVSSKAKIDFNVGRRGVSDFEGLDHIHPEKPCCKFENNNNKKRFYSKDLQVILENKAWLIDEEKVTKSLVKIHNEIKSC